MLSPSSKMTVAFALLGMVSASSAWAEVSVASQDASPAVAIEPSPAVETSADAAAKAIPAANTTRSRPSDALMRALMVITSAGGGRPFPLVPR